MSLESSRSNHEVELPAGCEPRCPGCRHRAWDVVRSETQKKEWLKRALAPWSSSIEDVRGIQGQARWGYREKGTLAAEWTGSRWEFGMRLRVRGQQGWSEEFVSIPDCPVHSNRVQRAVAALSEGLPSVNDFPLVFVHFAGGLFTLVVKSAPRPIALSATLEAALKKTGVSGLFLNFNSSAGNRVLSSRGWVHLWGERESGEEMIHGPESFQQLIPSLHQAALDEAESFLVPVSGDRVLDLCSGIGLSLRRWAARSVACLGVELSGDSVRCAERNVGLGVCLRGRASERIPQMQTWCADREGRLLVFANPPRLGLEPEVTRWLARSARPDRIAYLSCSAGSLARDLSVLSEAGYAVRRIIPYDFFPHTHHIETLVFLERA